MWGAEDQTQAGHVPGIALPAGFLFSFLFAVYEKQHTLSLTKLVLHSLRNSLLFIYLF